MTTADDIAALLAAHDLPPSYHDMIEGLHRPMARRIVADAKAGGGRLPFVVALCGAQGSGKTTAAAVLKVLIEQSGSTVAILSLDDLYLTLADRRRLAADIHPLLMTRSVPGTHDPAAGLALMTLLGQDGAVALPRFDKAADDLISQRQWPVLAAPVDILLFEGWCVGARPEPVAALSDPVNQLERVEDTDGVWRHYVNAQLAGPYRALFDRPDRLILFAAPCFEVVAGWRAEQEEKLRTALARTGRSGGQPAAAIARFVQHYERVTRHILAEMPLRADIVVSLDRDRRIVSVRE